MVEGMPNGFSRVIELSGDLSDGHAIAPSPPNRAVVIHRKHFLCLRASEPIPVGTFTIHGCARVGPSYALILPPGGSLLRAHFHVLEQSDDKSQYLQAGSALALYYPSSPRWQTVGGRVARAMVTVNAVQLGFWLDALRPVRGKLTAPLATIYRDTERPETERSLAFNILGYYASGQPNVLVVHAP